MTPRGRVVSRTRSFQVDSRRTGSGQTDRERSQRTAHRTPHDGGDDDEMSVVPGKLLGMYRMVDVVGEGSFGQVWKARKVGALQTVAIKLIPKAGKKEKEIQGLRQEIDILKTLRHENIIQMLDAFETPSDFCVVTEFAQGELFEILETDTSLSEEVVRTIAKQLVAALHYLHSNRIIHRDMKPQNILISADGTVKLCDFGFARAMSQDTFVLTSIKGTPLYMAPELVQEQPYTPAVDVWSMGVILYELFVGKPPFYTTSIYKLIKQIVNEAPVFPSAMSRDFKSFLQGVLEKDPKKRLGWPELARHPFVSSGDDRADDDRLDGGKLAMERSQSSRSTRSTRSDRRADGNRNGNDNGDASDVTNAATTRTPLATPPTATATPPSATATTATQAVPRASPIPTSADASNVRSNNRSNKIQEPTFVNPPQWSSPEGSLSPSDGPMGSALADRLPSGPLPQSPPVIALLVDAERRIQRGIEEPSRVVTDPAILEAITSALNPPSGGRGLTAWCKLQETQYVATLVDKVMSRIPDGVPLHEVDPSGQLTSVLVLLAKAGHLCVGTSPQFAGTAAAALRKCDDWVVCLETVSLCSELISSRGSWAVAIEGCDGIRAWAVRAQCALLPGASSSSSPSSSTGPSPGPSPGSSSRSMAKKLVDRFVAKKLPGRICRCIEDYDAACGGSVGAEDKLVLSALKALASLLPCLHDGVAGCACMDVRWPRREDEGGDASKTPPSGPTTSVLGLWNLTARYVFESKETVKSLVRVISKSPFTTMAIRLVRLEPRLGRPLMMSRIPDGILDGTRRDAAALLGKEIFDGVAATCTGSDVAFLEQQCGARLSAAVKREWIPVLSSSAELLASSAACGAIASYMLLFNGHWSAGSLYSHLNGLKGKLADIESICSGGVDVDRGHQGHQGPAGRGLAAAEGLPSTTCMRDGAFELALAIATLDHKQATTSGLVAAAMDAVLSYEDAHGTGGAAVPKNNVGSDGNDQKHRPLSLSPSGIAACLRTLQVGAENDADTLERMAARDGLAEALVAFLSPEFAAYTAAFYGPGDKRSISVRDAARAAVLAIVQAPWVHGPMLCRDPDAVAKAFKRQLTAVMGGDPGSTNLSALIPHVVRMLREADAGVVITTTGGANAALTAAATTATTTTTARTNDPSSAAGANAAIATASGILPSCAAVLARMALAFGDEAVVAFARSGGLDRAVLKNLLSDRNPDSMLGSSLLVVSQLARTATAKSQVERFLEAGIMPLIPPLLRHPTSSGVRARACNLLGNLCRHSDAAYPSIRELGVLPPLVDLCEDGDQSTRKFACFAIGNAGFHSDYLYEDLRPAVRTLVHLLQDEEDRTVANAAGALGNLVRNSGELVPEMLACGAVEALLGIVTRDGSTLAGSTAFQISLFSLGNLAAHGACRATLEALGVADVMNGIQRDPSASRSAAKYASRVLTKMSAAGATNNCNGAVARPGVQQTPFVPSKSRPRTTAMTAATDDF